MHSLYEPVHEILTCCISRECSGSVVECLTQTNRPLVPASMDHCFVVLEQDTFILA